MAYNLINSTSGPAASFGTGKFNQSVSGGGVHVAIPFDTTADFSVEAWILSTSSAGFQIAFGKDNDFFMGIRGDGNYSVQYNAASGATAVGTTVAPTDGLFHHVSFNHDHLAGTRFYIDGVLVGSNSFVISVNPVVDFYVLNIRDQTTQSWGGYIDELVIWNTAKRTANFTPPTVATPNSTLGITALYHFDNDLTDNTGLVLAKAKRLPLVLVNGQIQQLQTSDALQNSTAMVTTPQVVTVAATPTKASSYTLATNSLSVGSTYRFVVYCTSTATINTTTLSLRFGGSNTYADTVVGSLVLGAGTAVAGIAKISCEFTLQLAGSTGTAFTSINCANNGSGGFTTIPFQSNVAIANGIINTTKAGFLGVYVSTSVANIITIQSVIMETVV